MTLRRERIVGLDRPIRIEWLDALAGHVAAGATPAEIRKYLWSLLEGVVGGTAPRSARGKTVTVLARVWLNVPLRDYRLRGDALHSLRLATDEERFAIHWAMTSVAYPFFVDVASNVGRLLALNGQLALSQLQARMIDSWGDRSTVTRSVQRVVRSMVAWGALDDGAKAGHYQPCRTRRIVHHRVSSILLESLLVRDDGGRPLNQILRHPALFPFDVHFDMVQLRANRRLKFHRQGDQSDVVERTAIEAMSKDLSELRARPDNSPTLGPETATA